MNHKLSYYHCSAKQLILAVVLFSFINRLCLFIRIFSFVGFQLVSFDYSQLELRVLAHLSNDEKLKTRLTTNTDFFISLAVDLLKKSEHEITGEQRQHAKQVRNLFLFIII